MRYLRFHCLLSWINYSVNNSMLFPAQQMLVRFLKSVILCLCHHVLKIFILPAVRELSVINANSSDTGLLMYLLMNLTMPSRNFK